MIIPSSPEESTELKLAREATQSYTHTFLSAQIGQTVLKDLMLFCFALTSTVAFDRNGAVDPLMTMQNEGRRAVWNRIQQRLGLTTEELYALCRGGRINRNSEDE